MQVPAHVPLAADRYTPFVVTISFVPVDLTGATFKAQVRDRKDGGTVRADLATVGGVTTEGVTLVYADTDTVANHLAAGRLSAVPDGYETTDSVAVSYISIRINEATMEAMPFGTEIGDDIDLYWDLHVTPSGGVKEVYAYGKFTVRAGVTQ